MNTGGPAFPGVEYKQPGGERGVSVMTIVGGMTLRDYFAAKALQGFISRGDHYDCDFDADRAYNFADAMLKAREQ
jgi:hypothetical protein